MCDRSSIGLIFTLSVLLACCSAQPQASVTKWETGGLTHRGHEDITRYGVQHANEQLAAITGAADFFPVPAKGVAGADTGNNIVRGNFETDFPQKKFLDFYEAENRVPGIGWIAWHESPRLQHLHALRNRPDAVTVDAFAGCQQSTKAIGTAMKKALEQLRLDQASADGQHWLGHATHIIQDSFSPAHVVRDGKQLLDHCTYGARSEGVCYHEESDERDRIWKQDGGSCEFDPNQRNWACLIPEAKAAAMATAGFLALAGRLALEPDAPVDSTLRAWMHGDDKSYEGGYFDCRPIGLRLLNDFYRFFANDDLLPSDRASLLERLALVPLDALRDEIFAKYGPQIVLKIADGDLDQDLMQRYLGALREFGYAKLSARIFIDDAAEIIKRRVLAITGKDVNLVRLPLYTNMLIRDRSIRKLDQLIRAEIEPVTLPPAVEPDPCANLPTPMEVLKCRMQSGRLPE